MKISDIRSKYPDYDDLTDDQLLRGIHAKDYSDMNYDEFAAKFEPETTRDNPHPPTFSERVKSREINTRQQREPSIPGAAILEPALSLGGSALGTSLGGVAGLVTAPFIGADRAAGVIKGTQDFFSYEPQTERGQASLENIGKAGEFVGNRAKLPLSIAAGGTKLLASQYDDQSIEEGLPGALKTGLDVQTQGPSKVLSESIFEATESPLLATAGLVLPDVIAAIVPYGLSKYTKLKQGKQEIFKRLTGEKVETFGLGKDLVPQPVGDVDLAPFMVKGLNKIDKDSLAKQIIKQGVDPEIVVLARGSTNATKEKLLKQMRIAKRAQAQPHWGVDNRPGDVAGESLNARVQHLQMVRENAASQLDNVAEKLKGQTVNFRKPVDRFLGKLNKMGINFDDPKMPGAVKIPKNKKAWEKIFEGSDIENLSAPENAIKNIIKRMASGELGRNPSAYQLHQLKIYIDNNVVYGKSPGGLIGKVKNELKSFRHEINTTLKTQFPEYGRVNTTYHETTTALDELSKAVKLDLSDIPDAEKYLDDALGQELRKLITNYKARNPIRRSLAHIDTTMRKYGGHFDDDITTQMLFADMLDDIYSPAAKGSMKGILESGMTNVLRKNAVGVAQDMSEEAIKHMHIKSAEQAAKLMEELLKRKAATGSQDAAYRAARWPEKGKDIIPR